jgi:hypothetical protein
MEPIYIKRLQIEPFVKWLKIEPFCKKAPIRAVFFNKRAENGAGLFIYYYYYYYFIKRAENRAFS